MAIANYLCGLATVTSCSRMLFAFARAGGLTWSRALARVSRRHRVRRRFAVPPLALSASGGDPR